MMSDETFLYDKIANSIRKDILDGKRKPGDRLPSVRELCIQWNCTPGTIQRAYKVLANAGLIISRAGDGTRVAGMIPRAEVRRQGVLRKAGLLHRTEDFLLEVLTSGYDLAEIQDAVDLAMDRWRALEARPAKTDRQVIRFTGSHDMAVNGLTHAFFGDIEKDCTLQILISGSIAGLTALSEGRADFCGCHLWDAETKTYNVIDVKRVFPEGKVMLVTLAERDLGIITSPGNPLKIFGIEDFSRPGIRFINRQAGSGTRVWLDAELVKHSISPQQIQGYKDERMTHSDIARAVAENSADTGLGLESAAAAYGLDFILLTRERYDLVMLDETAQTPVMAHLISWLQSSDGKAFVSQYKGYDSRLTGQIVSL